jgi:hypothetical protein
MTRPYRWRTLLGSKLLFAAVFIHVPLLIAGAAILGIHGFQPLAYLPQLLWKQIVLAAVLTVPAMALAALLKNLAQFLLAAIVNLGVAAYLAGVAEPFGLHWIPPNVVRYSFAGFMLALAACALLPIQYARRRTTWMPIGVSQAAAGAGHCSSIIVESPRLYLNAALKVLCESPNATPMPTELRLWQPETGRDWTQRLGANSMANVSTPRDAWLSPLDRSDTLWPFAPEGRTILSGDRWQMPRDALVNAKLAITPNETTAWAVVDFDFPDVTLSDYVRPRAR